MEVESSQWKGCSNRLEKAEATGKDGGKVHVPHRKPLAPSHQLGSVAGILLFCPVDHLTPPQGRVKEKS